MTVPAWPEGTAAVLSTAGPHAIPVSTAVRAGPRRVLLALAGRRESLARLREDPRATLTVMAGDLAFTLHGRVTEDGEAEGTVVLRLDVERVQDHLNPTFAIEAGVAWRWTDDEAAARDAAIREQLRG